MSNEAPQAAAPIAVVNEPTDTVAAVTVPKVDPKLDSYIRKEKQLRQMRKEIEARETAIKSQEAKYSTGYIDRKRLEADPLGVLNEMGLSYESLTEKLLNQQSAHPEVAALKAELAALRGTLDEDRNAATVAQQKAYETAAMQIKSEVNFLVNSNAEYETIKEMGMQEAVFELIEQTFNEENGRLMTAAEAASQIEEELVNEALRLAKLNKVQSRLQSVTTPEASKAPQAAKTLTNTLTTQTKTRLSEKDRIERAILAAQGKLTS